MYKVVSEKWITGINLTEKRTIGDYDSGVVGEGKGRKGWEGRVRVEAP